jgi:hypothetical protein
VEKVTKGPGELSRVRDWCAGEAFSFRHTCVPEAVAEFVADEVLVAVPVAVAVAVSEPVDVYSKKRGEWSG